MEKCGNGVIGRMQTVLQVRVSVSLSVAFSLSVLQVASTSHTSGGRGGGNIEREQPWSEFELLAGSSGKWRRAAVIKRGSVI